MCTLCTQDQNERKKARDAERDEVQLAQMPGSIHPQPAGWPTTRRHPRSLSEAFADERAPSVERHRARGFFAVFLSWLRARPF